MKTETIERNLNMKRAGVKLLVVGLGAGCLLLSTFRCQAFALLGPVQPWMQATKGVVLPGDIGGPMDITNGYRWNVPVVTYGFDKSFLDFFGTNGVAAVKGAIKILNDLPPASQIILTNYPFNTLQVNNSAQAQVLLDLKSWALSLLLEQLGLAPPTRNIYVVKNWNPFFFNNGNGNIYIVGMPIFYESDNGIDPAAWSGSPGYVPYFIKGLNFDPKTFAASDSINNTEYGGNIIIQNSWPQYIQPYSVNPLAHVYAAAADNSAAAGDFYTGLTYDDVGGLCYLLSTNNVRYENLLSGVQGAGTNSASFVNGAWRPGVDKITFVLQTTGSLAGTFLRMTNQFIDTYITNGKATHQQLQRVTIQPDFLFSARNDTFQTGTTNWINNAALNFNTNGAGPGIIQPPVVIAFQKAGNYFYSSTDWNFPVVWSEDTVQDGNSWYLGSYDGSTNLPIAYPTPQTGNVSMLVRVRLSHSNNPVYNFQSFEWSPTSQAGTVYALQTSTNMTTWNTLFVVTNNGSVCTYQNVNANSASRFYRLTPQ